MPRVFKYNCGNRFVTYFPCHGENTNGLSVYHYFYVYSFDYIYKAKNNLGKSLDYCFIGMFDSKLLYHYLIVDCLYKYCTSFTVYDTIQ